FAALLGRGLCAAIVVAASTAATATAPAASLTTLTTLGPVTALATLPAFVSLTRALALPTGLAGAHSRAVILRLMGLDQHGAGFFARADAHLLGRHQHAFILWCQLRRHAVDPQRHAIAARHEEARLLVAPQFQQTARLRLFQQVAEGAKAVVLLAEARIAALERFLQNRCPHAAAFVPVGDQGLVGLGGHLHHLGAARVHLFAAALFLFGRAALLGLGIAVVAAALALAFAHQVVVEDELVAVGDQKVRSRLLD